MIAPFSSLLTILGIFILKLISMENSYFFFSFGKELSCNLRGKNIYIYLKKKKSTVILMAMGKSETGTIANIKFQTDAQSPKLTWQIFN